METLAELARRDFNGELEIALMRHLGNPPSEKERNLIEMPMIPAYLFKKNIKVDAVIMNAIKDMAKNAGTTSSNEVLYAIWRHLTSHGKEGSRFDYSRFTDFSYKPDRVVEFNQMLAKFVRQKS